jgi:signal transduction histidine kinase
MSINLKESKGDYQDLNVNSISVIRFVNDLSQALSSEGSVNNKLPGILEMIGRYLNAQFIQLNFINGDVKQELVWTNTSVSSEIKCFKKNIALRISGLQNKIIFSIQGLNTFPETLFELVANLLDFYISAQLLLTAEQSQRQLVESINNVSKILTSTLDRDEVLSLFVNQLENLAPYDTASVMLLQDGLLYMCAAKGYENFGNNLDVSKVIFEPEQTFLMKDVLNGREPVLLNDTRESPEWQWLPIGAHIRSWMGVPLIVNGETIGLFSLDKSIPNFFTERHAQLASAMAKHASLAIANAMLFSKVQKAHKEMQGLSAQVIKIQENERLRIAQELHDHSGQALLALRAELQVLRKDVSADDDKVQQRINYLDQIVLEISEGMEQLAFDLRPPTLSDFGLVTALNQYILDFEKRMGITAIFVHNADLNRLPDNIELICYRIVQEALTNLAKHAGADHVEITLNFYEGFVTLVVKDNGSGFVNNDNNKGYGLLGIRERLNQVGGNLEIKSQLNQGTEIIVSIPIIEWQLNVE